MAITSAGARFTACVGVGFLYTAILGPRNRNEGFSFSSWLKIDKSDRIVSYVMNKVVMKDGQTEDKIP
jgi:hypothetical protein